MEDMYCSPPVEGGSRALSSCLGRVVQLDARAAAVTSILTGHIFRPTLNTLGNAALNQQTFTRGFCLPGLSLYSHGILLVHWVSLQ